MSARSRFNTAIEVGDYDAAFDIAYDFGQLANNLDLEELVDRERERSQAARALAVATVEWDAGDGEDESYRRFEEALATFKQAYIEGEG